VVVTLADWAAILQPRAHYYTIRRYHAELRLCVRGDKM